MSYNKTIWQDLPSTATPLNATNLNKIENELEAVDKSLKYMGNAPVDLNEARNFGVYKLREVYSNAPVTNALYGILIVYESNGETWIPGGYNSGSWIWQEIRSASGDIYVRGAVNTADSWSDWEQINKGDTGWIDISSYLNTTYFTIRQDYTPKMRRIGDILYFSGEVYITTALSTPNSTMVFSNLPFFPITQQNGTGKTWSQHRLYTMWFEGNKIMMSLEDGSIQGQYNGFNLSCMNGTILN